MAIDTAEKRRSLSGIQTTLLPGVTPNAGKDQEWRQESGWGYSGILASALTTFSETIIKFTIYIDQFKSFTAWIDRKREYDVEM